MTEAEAKIKDLELQIKELNDKVDKLLEMHKPNLYDDQILPYKADYVPQTQAFNLKQ